VVRLIFARFRELGSARQAFLSMWAQQVQFPRPSDGKRLVVFERTRIRDRNVISMLKKPFYVGAYAYGKNEKRTEIVDERARKSYGHPKPLEQWEVLLKDHHDGYIEPMAIEAAVDAVRRYMEAQGKKQRIVELELQQARYEASLAERRDAACDPDNRLIAVQLENRWEAALCRVETCQATASLSWQHGPDLLFNFAALREKSRSVSWVRRGKNETSTFGL
jgi:hypothetical protein